jgi:hypothetical protein
MSLEERVLQLENENNALREELEATKVHLKKYTAPAYHYITPLDILNADFY